MKLEVLENIISVQEAAEIWGMSAERVKKLAQNGDIYAKKIGNTWVIDKYQRNPRRYNKGKKTSVHYEALKLNAKVFDELVFTKNPVFRVVEDYEDGMYAVYVYFNVSILKKGAKWDSAYTARKILLDLDTGEDLDISFDCDDLLSFDNDFIKHIDTESTRVAKRCYDVFMQRL